MVSDAQPSGPEVPTGTVRTEMIEVLVWHCPARRSGASDEPKLGRKALSVAFGHAAGSRR